MDPTILERLSQLHGRKIWQIRVDNELWLEFFAYPGDPPGSKDIELVVGGEFAVTTADGEEHHLDDDHLPSDLGPAMELLWQAVAAVTLGDGGELAIEFEDGAALFIPTHAMYEAWRVSGPGWRPLVSPPGGGDPTWPVSEFDL